MKTVEPHQRSSVVPSSPEHCFRSSSHSQKSRSGKGNKNSKRKRERKVFPNGLKIPVIKESMGVFEGKIPTQYEWGDLELEYMIEV